MDPLSITVEKNNNGTNSKKITSKNSSIVTINNNRIININNSIQEYKYISNFIKTSKYEIYNFLPIFLTEEFNPKTKFANCYFLLIAGLQCIPQISNTNGLPTVLIPLLFVVFINAILAIIEDYSRHKADKLANSSWSRKFDSKTKQFVDILWSNINVGDIIMISNRQSIPADMIILGVDEKDPITARGTCYVETKSLDGETNLKMRHCIPYLIGKYNNYNTDELNKLHGKLIIENPNKIIDSFNGVIEYYFDEKDDNDNNYKETIIPFNVLLRGCVLRNTEWIIGLVINTGHDTKIMMSATKTKAKTSCLETSTSNKISIIILLLLVFCFIGSTGQAIWNDVNDIQYFWYLKWDYEPVSYWFIKFAYYLLLHAQFIPVSLYVSMSLIRVFQTFFMNNDLDMYYELSDSRSQVRTISLNEELGQISHIFSDKTGTLTCNVMEFRKASINGVSYGTGTTEIGKASYKLQGKTIPQDVLDNDNIARKNSVPHVAFYDPNFDKDIHNKGTEQHYSIKYFFKYISLCHDVIPETIPILENSNKYNTINSKNNSSNSDIGPTKLSASNPDDHALVCAADYFGYQFKTRIGKRNSIVNKSAGIEECIDVLETIGFTSKRKRMTVIINDINSDNGMIRLLTKGADIVMYDRLKDKKDKILTLTQSHIQQYAEEGLRCLVVCTKLITKEQFNDWNTKYVKACTDMEQLEKLKNGELNDIESLEDELEQNLELLGATAIEDRLQDGVSECIELIKSAGIKIWMLTGDKEETAINIAIACNLLLPEKYMEYVIVNSTKFSTAKNIEYYLSDKLIDMKQQEENWNKNGKDPTNKPKPIALILDGTSLLKISLDEDCKTVLTSFSMVCSALIANRVSPDQKRELVRLVKNNEVSIKLNVRTLAIGDGANDVAMIQEAHVGVGIKGEEGVQAVNSSDYAIAQFKFLAPLLLKHGRFNYIRMSNLVTFIFYKNILVSCGMFWFNFYSAFSGQKYYTEGAIQFYNLIFTSLPCVFYGIYDQDLNYDYVLKNLKLYTLTILGENFGYVKFSNWIIMAIYESVLISILPLFLMHNYNDKGSIDSFWEPGAVCYTIVIIVVNLKFFFLQSKWYWFNYVVIILSIFSWFAVAYAISLYTVADFNYYHLWEKLLASGTFYLTIILVITVIFIIDLVKLELVKTIHGDKVSIVREMEMCNKTKVVSNSHDQPMTSVNL